MANRKASKLVVATPANVKPPFFYSIDIVGRCNLSCASCPQGNNAVRLEKHFMSPVMLHSILDKATSEAVVFGVGLFNWGEPFTHPKLPELVNVVNSFGLLCYLSSNLNSIPRLSEVLAEEPHSIRISCSGFTQEIYSKTHCKGDIEKVKANMRLLSQLRRPKTNVHVLWHRYEHNAHEEYLMREFAESLGFEFKPIEAYYMPLESVLDIWDRKAPLPEINGNLHTGLMEHRRLCAGRQMECRNQTQEITIDALGRVQLCCGVYDPSRFTLCNYLETPLRDIQAMRFSHSFCDRCIASGGHVYVAGYSHRSEGMVRHAAKKVYRKIAPLVPNSVLRMVL